jgi:hypothetical protein
VVGVPVHPARVSVFKLRNSKTKTGMSAILL